MADAESDEGINPFQISGLVKRHRSCHIDLHRPRHGNVLACPEALIDYMLQQFGSARIEVETAIAKHLLEDIAGVKGCRGSNVSR